MESLASGSVGRRLLQARRHHGLTMAALAKLASVGAATINHIEKGRQIPGADTIERLARAMEIDPCWLAYGTGKKPDWDAKAKRTSENP